MAYGGKDPNAIMPFSPNSLVDDPTFGVRLGLIAILLIRQAEARMHHEVYDGYIVLGEYNRLIRCYNRSFFGTIRVAGMFGGGKR